MPAGAKNKATRERIAAATANGALLPHEIALERARVFYDREVAYRQAAQAPDIDPELQRNYILKADELAQASQVFCRDASPYYAPRLTAVKVGADTGAGPVQIELVNFRREDCLPARRSEPGH
jgi:hypothetical protein